VKRCSDGDQLLGLFWTLAPVKFYSICNVLLRGYLLLCEVCSAVRIFADVMYECIVH
jgi:hypothetical protein